MSARTILITKQASAPNDPTARRLYIAALRRQHEAGLLYAKIRAGELPEDLLSTILPHLAGPVVPAA